MKKRRVVRTVASLLVAAMLCAAFGVVTFAAGPTVKITSIEATDQETYWQMSVPYTVTEWTEGMQLAVLAYDVTSITENPESAAYSESTPIGYITQADAVKSGSTFSFRARKGDMEAGDTVAAFEGGDKILVKIGGSGVATPAAMLYTFPGGSTTPSSDASISSIKIGGYTATSAGSNAYTISVPEGTEINADAIVVTTTDDGASVQKTDQGSNSWQIKVTAEDNTTIVTYTLSITFIASSENTGDVNELKEAIDAVAGTSGSPTDTFTFAQASVIGDNEEEQKAALASLIEQAAAKLDAANGISLFDAVSTGGVNVKASITAYTAAIEGTHDDQDGTAGSATATVTLTKGMATATTTVYAGITPTLYTLSSAKQLTALTVAEQTATLNEAEKTATVTLDYDVEVTEESFTATVSEYASYEVSGSGDSWTLTVTAEDGTTQEYTVTISRNENPDIAVVAGVKGAISTAFAAATMDGSSATTAAEAKAVAEGILAGVELNGVTAVIDGDGVITTAAIDATKTDLDGTDGTYTATINLSLSDVTDRIDVNITIKPAVLQAITAVTVNVTEPAYGAAQEDATVDGAAAYTVVSTTWDPTHETFQYNQAYSVSVVLEPKDGYIFNMAGDEGDGTTYTWTDSFEALTEPTFTITKGAETNGTFTVSPEGPAAAGTEITVTATPAEHYVVDTMTYTGSGAAQDISFTGNTGTFNMPAENVTVNVTFKMNEDYAAVTAAAAAVNEMTFDAIAQADANTEDAVKDIIEGLVEEEGLTATVNTVGTFTAAVAGDAGTPAGTNGTYTFTVTYSLNGESATSEQKTVTITATEYIPPATFTITKGAETNGTFTVSPEGPAAAGTEITVTATPAEHYVVDTMTYTGSGAAQNISFTGNTGTFNMPAENVTVNVTFKMNEDYEAVTAAAAAVNEMTFNAIAQATANTEDAVKAIIEGLVAEDGLTAVVNTASFTAAVAGDADATAGTNGSYAFTVTYSLNAESATSVEKTVTITATRYTAPPIEGAQNVTLGLEATSDPAVFDIVLTPDAGQAITRFNAAEFTLVQTVNSGTISSVVTAGEGLNIIPDAVTEGKYLVSLQVAADGTTTPITKGTDEKLILGQITLSGIAEGSLGVTAAKGYMESAVNNEVVELNVTAAADANFSLQVETVPVTVRVDFINAVDTTKDADYTDMTVTVTSALGSTVYDLSSANAVAGLDDSKTAFEVETEMVAGIRYTVRLQGGGYRDASKTITPAAGGGETVYFWNNVMTEGQTLPDGTTTATAENNKNFVAGDIQMDNRIDIYDLNAVVSYFGMIDMDQDYNTYNAYIRYDLNRDGKIDARDVAMVLVSWGE